jgi:ribosomal protein S12 methylthiotransferase accessory factor
LIIPPSSNGLATGRSISEAILLALYEVLERDAFLITWLNRLQAMPFDPATHPSSRLRTLCAIMGRQGIDIQLFMMAADHSCRVFMAIGRSEHGKIPAVACGLGADLRAESGALKAILEMAQNHYSLVQMLRRPFAVDRMHKLADDPGCVTSIEDHGLLYASPAAIAAFNFLFDRNSASFEWPRPSQQSNAEKLHQLVREISSSGSDVYYVNMTPQELSQLGLACVRVIVPHFQPIHFGAHGFRLGGRRLFDLPVRLGLAKAPRHINELNKDPHPLG